MGHALNSTLQDILIRYHRMSGKSVLWQPGLDHAGIATQTVVERQLRAEGIDRRDLGREEFLKRVWAWKEQSGGTIVGQMKRLGTSCDWSRLRFTMDDHSSQAVLECFVRLWHENLIYRGERLINWDPASQTALSDLEVDHEEREGELWRFAYRVKNSSQEIVVATTRPETMLGDTAVAVHPNDERFRDLVGKQLEHPFFPARIFTVVADDAVDPEFGTGAVKVTPAHDPNDFAIGARHGLESLNILTLDAKINGNGGEFAGLDRFEARKEVKRRIAELGLDRGSESIKHAVTVSQRSGAVVEPMISRQFFVQAKTLAQNAQKTVAAGDTELIPESWKKTWDHFLDNIQDWCISRQLWWGHRIPVYYEMKRMETIVRKQAAELGIKTSAAIALDSGASPAYVLKTALATLPDDRIREFSTASVENLAAVEPDRYIQEEDVLDTWFSSALWPFSTLGWPNDTQELKHWYPNSVLITAFDILFFWVARMQMMGVHLLGQVPFKQVVLHAIVRDEHGEKMSKTKGNVVDPLELIDAYGADALRFTLASMTTLGRDINLNAKRIEGYRHFANKLWNAGRFVLRAIAEYGTPKNLEVEPTHPLNRWLLTDIGQTAARASQELGRYNFGAYAQETYQLAWDRYCDWYIEGSKSLLRDETYREETVAVLIRSLEAILRMLHPVMPFITEEIAAALPTEDDKFVTLRGFPVEAEFLIDEKAHSEFSTLVEGVHAVRAIRGENGLPANQPLELLLDAADNSPLQNPAWLSLLQALARVSALTKIRADAAPEFSGTYAGTTFQAWVPLSGLVDVRSEVERLEKVIKQAGADKTRAEKKLANADFVARAPADVVETEKRKIAEFSQIVSKSTLQLERMRRFT